MLIHILGRIRRANSCTRLLSTRFRVLLLLPLVWRARNEIKSTLRPPGCPCISFCFSCSAVLFKASNVPLRERLRAVPPSMKTFARLAVFDNRKRDIARGCLERIDGERDKTLFQLVFTLVGNEWHGPFSTIAVLIGCLYTVGCAVYTLWSRNLRCDRFTSRNALFARQRSAGACICCETSPTQRELAGN